jgi:hypothetical protein
MRFEERAEDSVPMGTLFDDVSAGAGNGIHNGGSHLEEHGHE